MVSEGCSVIRGDRYWPVGRQGGCEGYDGVRGVLRDPRRPVLACGETGRV